MNMSSEIHRKKNRISHEGLLPIITQAIGIFIVAYAILAGIYGSYWLFKEIDMHQAPLEIMIYIAKMVFVLLAMVWLISLPGFIIGALFPRINLTNNGFEYRFLFVNGKVKHDEIERIVRIQKPFRALAIVIYRPLGVARGLWLANLYGRFVKLYQPVILISGNLEKKKQLEQMLGLESIPSRHT